jgi:TonB family protein
MWSVGPMRARVGLCLVMRTSARLVLWLWFTTNASRAQVSSTPRTSAESAGSPGLGQSSADKSPYPGCPPPVLPEAAFFLADYSKLELTITADRDGRVLKVVISKPSQAKLYDDYTRKWVETHWKMPVAKSGEPETRRFIAPIVYPKVKAPPGGYYPAPDYPLSYMQSRTEGLVIVEMTVAPSGKVESARAILSSGHKGLDDHTVQWVLKKWRFPPGEARDLLWPVSYIMR